MQNSQNLTNIRKISHNCAKFRKIVQDFAHLAKFARFRNISHDSAKFRRFRTFRKILQNYANFAKKHNWIQFVYIMWACLISISTLVLKQHFIVDVASGLALASLSYYLGRKIFVIHWNKKLITNRCTIPFPKKLPSPNA